MIMTWCSSTGLKSTTGLDGSGFGSGVTSPLTVLKIWNGDEISPQSPSTVCFPRSFATSQAGQ